MTAPEKGAGWTQVSPGVYERTIPPLDKLGDYYLELGPMEMVTEPMSFEDDEVTIKVRQRARLVRRPVGEAKIVD